MIHPAKLLTIAISSAISLSAIAETNRSAMEEVTVVASRIERPDNEYSNPVFYFVFDALGVMVCGHSAGVDMSSKIESITKDATVMLFVFGVAFFAFCFGKVKK